MAILQKCITSDGLVMAAFIDSTDIVREARRLHACTPVAAAALGRLLTGVSLLGNKLKEKDASVTVRINGGGKLGSMIAVSDSRGNVRGYAQNPGLLIMPDGAGNLDIAGAVGRDGLLSVIKDYGAGEPYCAQIPLVSGEIAEDLTSYYAVSEQVPTVLALTVRYDAHWTDIAKAGGLLIQLMPAADDREAEKIENSLNAMKPLGELMLEGLSPQDILRKALSAFEVEFFDSEQVYYRCDCSLERVKKALATMGANDLREIAEKDNGARVECHFCDKVYVLTREELEQLADRISEKGGGTSPDEDIAPDEDIVCDDGANS